MWRHTRRSLKLTLTIQLLAVSCLSNVHGEEGQLDPQAEAFVRHPVRALRTVPRGFRIIALSNLAEYCASIFHEAPSQSKSAKKCINVAVRYAQSKLVSPYSKPLTKVTVDSKLLGRYHLYLSHFNIVLAAYQALHTNDRYKELSIQIAEHLRRASLRTEWANARSYPGSKARWPADQAAILYSLHVIDTLYARDFVQEPLERYQSVMRKTSRKTGYGLPPSELAGVDSNARIPRGCALSYMVRYLAPIDPSGAQRLWANYKKKFFIWVGPLAGFREWPRGINKKADNDSGPIVYGMGAAATGLGFVASQIVGDASTHTQLGRTLSAGRWLVSSSTRKAGASLLAHAIELTGAHWVPWFDAET